MLNHLALLIQHCKSMLGLLVQPFCGSLFSPYLTAFMSDCKRAAQSKFDCISVLARWVGLILETCYPFGWVSANICFTCQDELLFEMHLERRITKGSSSWWVTRQMAVIVQETQIYITGYQSCEKWERLPWEDSFLTVGKWYFIFSTETSF